MKPLIDADVLRYEVGFGSEFLDDDGVRTTRDYEQMTELFDDKIRVICEEVEATEPPLLFLSEDSTIERLLNKRGINFKKKENFRVGIAKTKVYKGHRKNTKPLHFTNITAYILDNFDYQIASGIEADDAMCIYQRNHDDTIICSRDKDLRICPGLHYSWECGKQSSIGPIRFDKLGFIELLETKPPKIFGGGLAFFYSQLLTGDVADNIPGIPRCGPINAYKTLSECETEEDYFEAVSGVYKEKFGEGWEEYLREQADLLWMVQELNENGEPTPYKFPEVVNGETIRSEE